MFHRDSINNVTLENKSERIIKDRYYFPCPVCNKMLLVKITKKNKPYCICNVCGVQVFVRGKKGIEKFNRLKISIE